MEPVEARPEFKDSKGDVWKLILTVGTIEDIKAEAGIDLDEMVNSPEKFASSLYEKPRKLVEMLWVMCEEQAAERQIDPKSFGKRFDRETIDKACDAFLTAIVTFYQRTSAGAVLRGNLPRMLREMDRKLETQAQQACERALSTIATGLPES